MGHPPKGSVLVLGPPLQICDNRIYRTKHHHPLPLTHTHPSFSASTFYACTCNHISDKLAVTIRDAKIQKEILLKYVVDLLVWRKIQRKFQLFDCYALLDRTYEAEGIMVEWLIPPSTSKALLTPRAQPWSAIDFLQRENVIRMTVNDDSCVYDIQVQFCIEL